MVPILTTRKNKYNKTLIDMGEALRTLRKQRNLTISQFAEIVDLSDKIISNYERGMNAITIESIVKIYRSNVFAPKTLSEILDIIVVQIIENE